MIWWWNKKNLTDLSCPSISFRSVIHNPSFISTEWLVFTTLQNTGTGRSSLMEGIGVDTVDLCSASYSHKHVFLSVRCCFTKIATSSIRAGFCALSVWNTLVRSFLTSFFSRYFFFYWFIYCCFWCFFLLVSMLFCFEFFYVSIHCCFITIVLLDYLTFTFTFS